MNGEIVHLVFSIETIWEKIKKLRELIGLAMERFDKDIREAATMAATELVENAVKHSAPCDNRIRFNLYADKNQIVITVANRAGSQEDLRYFVQSVEKLNTSDNPMELYLQRLTELENDSGNSKARLGLYRIAYEGEYDINYKLENDFLTVVASTMIG